jgi:hypothetical protein
MSHIDPGAWRQAAASLADPSVTAALIVQCGLDWLRPPLYGLRDEIDDAVMNSLLARENLSVERVVLRSLPVAEDLEPGELAALNAAHLGWLSRLAVSGALLPESRRPRVHLLIVAGRQRSVGDMDCAELRINGTWPDPDAAAAVMAMRDGDATTPLSGYGTEIDGPYGDADPSVYL